MRNLDSSRPGPLRHFLRRQTERLWDALGVRVDIRRKRSTESYEIGRHRFTYQRRLVDFGVRPGMRVLDIGSGGDPFPGATVLMERFVEPVFRTESLVTNNAPLIIGDIHHLPFATSSLDFVYSAHVLEVVDDPILACSEIMRVGRRGYIELPTFAKDMLFSWARKMQKWHVVSIGQRLCFFEYSDRQLSGVGSSIWHDIISDTWTHPLQSVFWENQDIFNVMFPWEHRFAVMVFYLDGSIRSVNHRTDGALTESRTSHALPVL